jgi:hypothetical protein
MAEPQLNRFCGECTVVAAVTGATSISGVVTIRVVNLRGWLRRSGIG